jgi:type IV secretory pathway VirB10-like protein
MKLVGVISTAVLSLALGVAVPAFAQEQHEQEGQKAPAARDEKKAQPEKSTKQAEKPAVQPEKNAKPEEKNAQQENRNAKPAEKNAPEQKAAGNRGGQIPADKFKAHFGQQHSFRVSQGDYNNHRFQYGGYSFGFVDPWPSNWLYTQNVYVIEIDGVYYLCNASFPGVNLVLSFTL